MRKIQLNTEQRPFVMVYQDFLESEKLDIYEKMIFIILKRFADDKSQCFPSLNKLAKISGLSKRKIQDTLKKLENKNIIKIEHRTKSDGSLSSNIYTLYDYGELWKEEQKEKELNKSEPTTEQICQTLKSQQDYKMSKDKSQGKFNDFLQNQYDFDELEQVLLEASLRSV